MYPDPKRAAKGIYWRPWTLVEGCTPVSEACRNCWAATETHMRACQRNRKKRSRYGGLTTKDSDGWIRFNGKIRLMRGALTVPLTTRRPTIWAIWNDLFHRNVPSDFRSAALQTMRDCPRHRFLVLTKRPDIARRWLAAGRSPPDNFWLGTTVENPAALRRVGDLIMIPAAKHWLSVEPLLESIDLMPVWHSFFLESEKYVKRLSDVLHWVVIGPETGPRRRDWRLEWVRDIVAQCDAAGVPVWIKALSLGGRVVRDLAEFPEDLRRREMP